MTDLNTVAGLRTALHGHVVAIDFEKQDGSKRHLLATTMPTYLETAENLTASQIAERNKNAGNDGDLIKAWDTENGGWRSFHFSQVTDSELTA